MSGFVENAEVKRREEIHRASVAHDGAPIAHISDRLEIRLRKTWTDVRYRELPKAPGVPSIPVIPPVVPESNQSTQAPIEMAPRKMDLLCRRDAFIVYYASRQRKLRGVVVARLPGIDTPISGQRLEGPMTVDVPVERQRQGSFIDNRSRARQIGSRLPLPELASRIAGLV